MSGIQNAWWDKWHWAQEHLRTFKDEIVRLFMEEKNQTLIRAENGPHRGEYVFRVMELSPAPLSRWGLQIGDIVQNLRAALDHLAWGLALFHQRGVEPTKPVDVFFPIYSERTKFDDSRARPYFSPFHWAIFEEFQPYHGRRYPDDWSGDYIHQLALLQILSNWDKHQTLAPILLPPVGLLLPGFLRHPSLGGVQGVEWESEPLKLGAIAVRYFTRTGSGLPRNVDVTGRVYPHVSFPQWGGVDAALDRLSVYVSRILREFEPLV